MNASGYSVRLAPREQRWGLGLIAWMLNQNGGHKVRLNFMFFLSGLAFFEQKSLSTSLVNIGRYFA